MKLVGVGVVRSVLICVFSGIGLVNASIAQTVIPTTGWADYTNIENHPLGDRVDSSGNAMAVNSPIASTVYGGNGSLIEGGTSDSGYFYYNEAGESDDFRLYLTSPSPTGKSGLMVRNDGSANSAFVFLGRDGANQSELVFLSRATAGGAIRKHTLPDDGGEPWLRLVVGRDAVYAYVSSNSGSGLPASWQFVGLAEIQLDGGAAWQRRDDLGGFFVEQGGATFSELLRTSDLIWNERRSDVSTDEVVGNWSVVSPASGQISASSDLLSHPGESSSTDYVAFKMHTETARRYEVFVHAVSGNPNSLTVEIWQGASIATSSVMALPGGNAWVSAGLVDLSGGDVEVRLYAEGATSDIIYADVARIVTRAATYGKSSFPGWDRTPDARIGRDNNWQSNNKVWKKKLKNNKRGWDSGANSSSAMIGDGVFRVQIKDNGEPAAVGLTDYPWGNSLGNIDYKFIGNGTVSITGAPQSYGFSTSTLFYIRRVGSHISLWKDGSRVYQTTNGITAPLYIDFIAHDLNAQVQSALVQGIFLPTSRANDLDSDSVSDDGDFSAAFVERWVIDADLEDDIQSVFDVSSVAGEDDPDGDGLTNTQEWNLAATYGEPTNPTKADTDGDGIDDNEEISPTTNVPATDPTKKDSDGDGLTDKEEIVPHFLVNPDFSIDPNVWVNFDPNDQDGDSDNDGVSDWVEWKILSVTLTDSDLSNDSLNSQTAIDGAGDFDGDKVSDKDESDDGTDPTDPNDYFFPIYFGSPVTLGDFPERGGLGEFVNADLSYIQNVEGIFRTRLERTMQTLPSGESSGGFSHHYLRDGSRIRFQFLDSTKNTSVGIAYHLLRETEPGDEPHYAVKIETTDDQVTVVSSGESVQGISTFSLTNSDLIELRLEMQQEGAQRLVIEKNFVEVASIPLAFIDLEDTPVVVAVSLKEQGAGISNARHRLMAEPDTDDDGLRDTFEKEIYEHEDFPNLSSIADVGADEDYDLDGLTNLEEQANDTKAVEKDSDGDGLWDGWEIRHGFDPVDSDDAGYDPDGDGLTNLQEFQNRDIYTGLNPEDIYSGSTNPFDDDTDRDGVRDDVEVRLQDRNPALADEPADLDSDGDGLPDLWELLYGFDIEDPGDGGRDSDYDSVSNIEEFYRGSVPTGEWKLRKIDPSSSTVASTALASDPLLVARTLNALGQLCFVTIDAQNSVQLVKWGRDGFGSDVDLGDAGAYDTIVDVKQNIFGEVVITLEDASDGGIAIWIWQEGEPMHILDGGGNWISIEEVFWTDSGFLVVVAVTSSGQEVVRWRNGGLETILNAGAVDVVGVTEYGEVYESERGIYRQGSWSPGSYSDLVAVSRFGEELYGVGQQTGRNMLEVAENGDWVMGVYPPSIDVGGQGATTVTPLTFSHYGSRGGYGILTGLGACEFGEVTWDQVGQTDYDDDGFPDYAESYFDDLAASNGETTYFAGDSMSFPGQGTDIYTTGLNDRGDFVGWRIKGLEMGATETSLIFWSDGKLRMDKTGDAAAVLEEPEPNTQFVKSQMLNLSDMGHVFVHFDTLVTDVSTGQQSETDWWGIMVPAVDSNEDGIGDDWAAIHGVGGGDPNDPEYLSTEIQYALGLSGSAVDTDGDALPDFWEVRNGLNPNAVNNPNYDYDGDGLTWYEEYLNGVDPYFMDSIVEPIKYTVPDGDHLEPDLQFLQPDSDGDGIPELGPDSDNDGMPDAFEIFYGLDEDNPEDAGEDPDRDHLTNLDEFLYGRNPNDAVGWREVILSNTGGIDFNDRDEAVVSEDTLIKVWRAGNWNREMEASNPVDEVSIGADGTVAAQIPDLYEENETELEIFTSSGVSSVSSRPRQELMSVSDSGDVYFSRIQNVVEEGITFPIELTKLMEIEKDGDYYNQVVPTLTFPPTRIQTDRLVGPVGNDIYLHVSRSIDTAADPAGTGQMFFNEVPVCSTELRVNGERVDLGTVPDGGYFVGVDVNRKGTIVGIWLEPGLINNEPPISEPTYDGSTESFPGRAMMWKDGQFIPLPFSPAYNVTVHGEFDTYDMNGGLSVDPVWLDIDDQDRVSAIVPAVVDPQSGERPYVSIQTVDDPEFPQMAYDADLVSCSFDENGNPIVVELANYWISSIDPAPPEFPNWPEFRVSDSGIIAECQPYLDIPPRIWFAGVSAPPLGNGVQKVNKNATLLYSNKMTVWRFPDEDHDGMSDDWEKVHGLNPGSSSDAEEDADFDGVSNYDEFWRYLDPQNSDSDFDSLPDGWELLYGFDPAETDNSNVDLNKDGLTLVVEAVYGIDPYAIDSDADNDGLTNYYEWLHGLDLNDPDDAGDDSDMDGLSNLREGRLKTDPSVMDTDGDGIPDSLEVMYRPSDPTDENSFRDYGLHFTLDSGDSRSGTISFPNTFGRDLNLTAVFDATDTTLTDADGLVHEWVVIGETGVVPAEGIVELPVSVSTGNVWTGPDLAIPIRLEDDLGNVILETSVSMSVKPEIRTSVSADLTTVQEGGLLPVQVSNSIPQQMTAAEVEVYINGKLVAETQTADSMVTVNIPVYLSFGETFDITARAYGEFGDRGPLSEPLSAEVNVIADSTDLDNLPDYWEQALVDWNPDDQFETIDDILETGDFDRDGLTNWEEYQNDTHPADPDEDGNGLYDGYQDALALSVHTSDSSQVVLQASELTRWKSSDIQSHDFLPGTDAPGWLDQVFRTTAGAVEFHLNDSLTASLAGSGISSSGDGYSVLGILVPQLGTFDPAHPTVRTLLTLPNWFDLYIDNGALGIRERHDGAYLAGGVQEIGDIIEEDEEESFGFALTYEPQTRELRIWLEQLAYFDAATPYLTVTLADLARDLNEIQIGSGTFGESAVDAKHGLWIVDPTLQDQERLGAFFEVAGREWRYGLPRDPEIRLTAPDTSGTYVAPARIKLAAEVIDADDPIDRVEFYDDGKLIGTDTEAPYEAVWSAKKVRTHAITARAIDIGGRSGDSTPRYVILTEPEEDENGEPEAGFEIPNFSSVFSLLQTQQVHGGFPFGFNPQQFIGGSGFGGAGGYSPGSGGFSSQTNPPEDTDGDGRIDSEDWVPYEPAIDQWDRTPVPRFLAIETGAFTPLQSNAFGMVLGYVGAKPDETAEWYIWYQGEWQSNKIDVTMHTENDEGETIRFYPPQLSQEHPVAYGSYVEEISRISCDSEDEGTLTDGVFAWAFTASGGFQELDRAESEGQQTVSTSVIEIISENEIEGSGTAIRLGTGCEGDCVIETTNRESTITWQANGNASANWVFEEFDDTLCDDDGTQGNTPCPYGAPEPISDEETEPDPSENYPGESYSYSYGDNPIRHINGEWVTPEGELERYDTEYLSYLNDVAEYNQQIADYDEGDGELCLARPTKVPLPYLTLFVTDAEYEMDGAVRAAWERETQEDAGGLLTQPVQMLDSSPPLVGVKQGDWVRGDHLEDENGNIKEFQFEPGTFTETGQYLWLTNDGDDLVPLRDGPNGNAIRLGTFESDRTMRVGDGGIDGLWANGVVHKWEELTGGYKIETWIDYSGGEGISCAKGYDRISGGVSGGLILLPFEFAGVDSSGIEVGRSNEMAVSNPQPVIRITGNPTVENITVDSEGGITADVTIVGEIIDPSLAMIASADAKINEVYMSVNGSESVETANVSSTPKQSNGQRGPIRYEQTSTFAKTLPGADLTEGLNVVEIFADNPVFKTFGKSNVTIEVESNSSAAVQTNISITFPSAPSDSVVDTLTVTINGQSTNLTETGVDTGEFSDGNGWDVYGADLVGPFDGALIETVEAYFDLPDGQRLSLVLTETSAGSLSFSGIAGYIPPGEPIYTVASIDSEQVTSAGTLQPYFVYINAIGLGAGTTLQFGDSEYEVREEASVGGGFPTRSVLMSNETSGQPAPFISKQLEAADEPADISAFDNWTKRLEAMTPQNQFAFMGGFFAGIGRGGWGVISDSYHLLEFVEGRSIAAIADVGMLSYLTVRLIFAQAQGGTAEVVARAALNDHLIYSWETNFLYPLLDAAEALAPVGEFALLNYQLFKANLSGDTETAGAVAAKLVAQYSTMGIVMQYALDLILTNWTNGSDFEKGQMLGIVAFEVGSIIIAETKVGKISKLEMLQKLEKSMGTKKGRIRNGWENVARKFVDFVFEIRDTKMCFVAGTLVMAQIGGATASVPIEQVSSYAAVDPAFRVWAKDEFTGEEGWKRPLQYFTTHPDELFHLSYDVDGDGTSDETLTGTGEHPFWLPEEGAFVELREIEAGDALYLANGGSVVVLENTRERAPPGTTFTTYNFEVEDFHTYFVGESGLWVHNFSTRFCDDFFVETVRAQDRLGITDPKGRRFEILKESLEELSRSKKAINGTTGNHLMHVTQYEEFADYAGDLSTIASVRQLKNLKAQNGAAGKWDAGGFEIHHTAERWISQRLGIADEFLDDAPGIPLRTKPDPDYDATYRQEFGHDPVYHGGSIEDDGLAANLNSIRSRFDNGGFLDETEMLEAVRDLYKLPRYKDVNMWEVTRDWLKQNVSDPSIIPE